MVEPLRVILRKSNEFLLSNECQESFEQLTCIIGKDPVLGICMIQSKR